MIIRRTENCETTSKMLDSKPKFVRKFEHAYRTSKIVKQMLGPFWNGRAQHQTNCTRHMPHQRGPKPRRNKSCEFENAEIDKVLCMNFREPPKSESASRSLFARKKNGLLRFCKEYRNMNAMIVQDGFQIPLMDECLDCLGEVRISLTLYASPGYQRI